MMADWLPNLLPRLMAQVDAIAEPAQPWFTEHWKGLTASAVLLGGLVLLRFLVARALLHRRDISGEDRRRVVVNLRNITLLLAIVGLMMIWAHELQTLALSVFAIAAALVLATKELILCISGSLVRGKSFAVGDRIEIGGQRGDVIDKSLMSTKLLEIGPAHDGHQYTGRTIVVPNSLFLSQPVANESALGKYSLHVFAVPMSLDDDWQDAERILLAAATAACKDFQRAAGEHWKQAEEEYGHYTPSAEPRVSIALPDAGEIKLLLRVPVPKGRKQKIEQQILRQFAREFKPKAKAEEKPSPTAGNGGAPNATCIPG